MRTYLAPLLTSSRKPVATPDGQPMYWFDDLLDSHLRDPDRAPLVVIVSGPPGAGKSLLVQQLCFNRARQHIANPASVDNPTSLYITTEASPTAILANLSRLGMRQDRSRLPTYLFDEVDSEGKPLGFDLQPGDIAGTPLMVVAECNTLDVHSRTPESIWNAVDNVYSTCLETAFESQLPHLVAIDSLDVYPTARLPGLIDNMRQRLAVNGPSYLILVIDNPSSAGEQPRRDFWSYAADACIRIEYGEGYEGYFTRTLEIVKTRHQFHVLGRQILKIFPWGLADKSSPVHKVDPEDARPSLENGGVFVFPTIHRLLSLVRTGKKLVTSREQPTRPPLKWASLPNYTTPRGDMPAHFGPGPITPSSKKPRGKVEWAAFRLKETKVRGLGLTEAEHGRLEPLINWRFATQAAFEYALDNVELRDITVRTKILAAGKVWDTARHPFATMNWPLAWCYELVGGGIPLNKCTALIGRRGARKSYFAYQFIYDGVCNGEQTMIVSFRDDPAAVRDALSHIAKAKHYGKRRRDLSPTNPIIIYQRPGCVTPEEFMHRIVAAVGEYAPTRVMVNAVDQWRFAYPLLARCELLLPCLVDFLGAHEVTSMIVGVESGGQPNDGQGLSSQAEVVLSFEWHRLLWPPSPEKRSSIGPATDGFPVGVNLLVPNPGDLSTQPKVVIRAVRVPRAAAGFGRAVLEFEPEETGVAGLSMAPLAPEYPDGLSTL